MVSLVFREEKFSQEQVDELWDYIRNDDELSFLRRLTYVSFPWRIKNPDALEKRFRGVVDYALDSYLEESKSRNPRNAKFFALKKTNYFYSKKSHEEMKYLNMFANY